MVVLVLSSNFLMCLLFLGKVVILMLVVMGKWLSGELFLFWIGVNKC